LVHLFSGNLLRFCEFGKIDIDYGKKIVSEKKKLILKQFAIWDEKTSRKRRHINFLMNKFMYCSKTMG
jgi:hypothetical protein